MSASVKEFLSWFGISIGDVAEPRVVAYAAGSCKVEIEVEFQSLRISTPRPAPDETYAAIVIPVRDAEAVAAALLKLSTVGPGRPDLPEFTVVRGTGPQIGPTLYPSVKKVQRRP